MKLLTLYGPDREIIGYLCEEDITVVQLVFVSGLLRGTGIGNFVMFMIRY